MERSLKLFLSVLFIVVLFSSCHTNEEKIADATKFGFHHYQGTPQHMNAFAYALELDSTNAENWRELSVTYLKRGIPHEWDNYFDKAIEYDAKTWQGWRGYLYLWFYRDYQKAIDDFNATDTLTPNFIDAPQGHSVDFWRGIAYLGLNDYKNSIAYFDKHISKETEETGEDWVELEAFLYRGIAHYESNNPKEALLNFDKMLFHGKDKSADAKYYKALIFQESGQLEEAIKLVESAITDYNAGYYNNRPYVETLRQIYKQDLRELHNKLSTSHEN